MSDNFGYTHYASQWEIYNDRNQLVYSTGEDTSKLLNLPFDFSVNQPGTYKIRVRYKNDVLGWSEWSQLVTFEYEILAYILTPTITYPQSGKSDVGSTLTLESSEFELSVKHPGETHESSDWEVYDLDDNLITSVNESNSLRNFDITEGVLEQNKSYKARVRYHGNTLDVSDWSDYITFSTEEYFGELVKPIITSPNNGSSFNTLGITVVSNDLEVNGGTDNHINTEWYMTDSSGNVIIDEIESGSNTTLELSESILNYNTSYNVRVRYEGDNLGWTPWSDYVSFSIGVAPSLDKPSVTFPDNGATDVSMTVTILGSTFNVSNGTDVHSQTQWILYEDGNELYNNTKDSNNLEEYQITEGMLEAGHTYQVKVRYQGENLGWSEWSNIIEFTMFIDGEIAKPSIVLPENGAENMTTDVALASTVFDLISGTDTHAESQWQISEINATETTIDRTEDFWLTYLKLDEGLLEYNKEYKVRIRHKGELLGWSEWSDWSSFSTVEEPEKIRDMLLTSSIYLDDRDPEKVLAGYIKYSDGDTWEKYYPISNADMPEFSAVDNNIYDQDILTSFNMGMTLETFNELKNNLNGSKALFVDPSFIANANTTYRMEKPMRLSAGTYKIRSGYDDDLIINYNNIEIFNHVWADRETNTDVVEEEFTLSGSSAEDSKLELVLTNKPGNTTSYANIEIQKQPNEDGSLWTFNGHSGNVNGVAVDAEGNVYSGSRDRTVKKIPSDLDLSWYTIYNSSKEGWINTTAGNQNGVLELDFTENGEYLAMGGYSANKPYMALYGRNNGYYTKYQDIGEMTSSNVQTVDFSPDSNYLVAGSSDNADIYFFERNGQQFSYRNDVEGLYNVMDTSGLSDDLNIFQSLPEHLSNCHGLYMTDDFYSTPYGTTVDIKRIFSIENNDTFTMRVIADDEATIHLNNTLIGNVTYRETHERGDTTPITKDINFNMREGDNEIRISMVNTVNLSAMYVIFDIIDSSGNVIYESNKDGWSVTGGSVNQAKFSPDNRYIAIASSFSPYVFLYENTGGTYKQLEAPDVKVAGEASSVSWSDDARYLGVAHKMRPYFTIYEVNNGSFNLMTPSPAVLEHPKLENVYSELLGRYPDFIGAEYWAQFIEQHNFDLDNSDDYDTFKIHLRRALSKVECEKTGWVYDSQQRVCLPEDGSITEMNPTPLSVDFDTSMYTDDGVGIDINADGTQFAVSQKESYTRIWEPKDVNDYTKGFEILDELNDSGEPTPGATKYVLDNQYLHVNNSVSPYIETWGVNNNTYTKLTDMENQFFGEGGIKGTCAKYAKVFPPDNAFPEVTSITPDSGEIPPNNIIEESTVLNIINVTNTWSN